MTHDIRAGAIVIKANMSLPKNLEFKSEAFVPGWKMITELDGTGFDRGIRRVGWNFFCLAGEVTASVFGTDAQTMLRRAVWRILKNPHMGAFNSLEIAQIVPVGSRRFPGVWYVTVSARLRHIQQSMFLCPKTRIVGGASVRLGETRKQPGCGADFESMTIGSTE